RPPVLRILRNEPLAQLPEAPLRAQLCVRAFETLKREMRPIGNFACERLPCLDRAGDVALLLSNVAEVQVRGGSTRIDVDGLGKRAPGGSSVAGATLRRADFVGQKRENLLVFGAASAVKPRDFAAHPQRLGPLILLFVELLQ